MGGEDDGGTGGGGGDDGPVGPPSCVGLAHECGPDGATDCCASDVVPEFVGPTRTIFSFELDRYEVTVGRFRKFLAAFDMGWRPTAGSGTDANNPQDRGWSWTLADDLRPRLTGTDLGPPTWTDAPGDNENRPLTRLDWNVAFAFCIWDGGRLPTQEEWRYVATGGESRVYPWSVPPTSRTIDQSYAVYDCMADGTMGCAITDILVVGSRPMGNGRFGQSDLSGSVWEWMRDLAPNQMPDRANGCGGGFFDVADAVTSTFCYAPPPRAVSGGRCARNIPR
jgi:formylglycine-generating enzyme required for sulfatase activity